MGKKIGILGAGSWATAVSVLLAQKGYKVKLWSIIPEQIKEINEARENKSFLPGITIPTGVEAMGDLGQTLNDAEAVVFGVPSHAFREVVRKALPHIPGGAILINLAKGIEEDSL
ncbi:MAG: NAD(P)-binding domain-containing protein, partial [Firmicutes bacterium]|nr:NAD(P)-binding domain-containing protein [Bacillota bacterium]